MALAAPAAAAAAAAAPGSPRAGDPSARAAGRAPVTVIGRDPGPASDDADDWQDPEYDEEADGPDSGRAEDPGEQYYNILDVLCHIVNIVLILYIVYKTPTIL